jgi:hypothetical protein
MRSVPQLEPEAPPVLAAADMTLVVDEEPLANGTQMTQGYGPIYNVNGTLVPDAVPGYPLHQIFGFLTQYQLDLNPESQTRVLIGALGPPNDNPPADAIQYVELWDDSGATPVRVLSCFMYQSKSSPDTNGLSFTQWEGFVDGPVVLDVGGTYKVYYSDQIANFTAVPEVRWVEESAPDQDTLLNPSTMPHVLQRNEDGSFSYGSMNAVSNTVVDPLARRASGDDITNPFPSFVGKKIKDVAFFQNRLALLTSDRVDMSVTNLPNAWFRGTVSQVLSTGPINIGSTSENASSLTHFVQHNNDLMIFSPTGQFRLDGRTALTPSNASLPQASAYPAELLAEPVSAGNDVFFPTRYGNSYGISQFSLDPQIDSLSLAKPMADNIIGLLKNAPNQIITAPNLGIIVVRLDDEPGNLYVMEFIPTVDILRDVVPTWSNWELAGGHEIISARVFEGKLYFAYNLTGESIVRMGAIDLNSADEALDASIGTDNGDIMLDYRDSGTAVGDVLTIPSTYQVSDFLVIVQGADGPNPHAVVGYTRVGNVLTLDEDLDGVTLYYGYPYTSQLTLPDVEPRDPSGTILSQAHLRITDWFLALTGRIKARVYRKPPVNAYYTDQEFNGIVTGTGYTDDIGFARTVWRIQFKQNPEDADLILTTNSHVDAQLHSLEWRGTYIKKGRRF